MCEALIENGRLTGRYELVDGEIISKMGQNPPHAFVIMRLMEWLVGIFGIKFVRALLSINVATADNETNEPEPDLAITTQPAAAYANRHPGPADLQMVVEVSDTTLRFDLRNKAALYARAGIAEYWVADLAGRRLVVHRAPDAQGYADVQEYAEDETAAPLARPEARQRVADLFPPVRVESE